MTDSEPDRQRIFEEAVKRSRETDLMHAKAKARHELLCAQINTSASFFGQMQSAELLGMLYRAFR